MARLAGRVSGRMLLRICTFVLALGIGAAACGGDDATGRSAGIGQPDRPIELGDAKAIPPLDLATLLVDADSIVFDTFDGSSVTLAEIDAARIASLLDAIAPIDAPDYEAAEEADWLAPTDVVLGYVDQSGDAWAFPVRILNFREIVNDQFAGLPVLVSYCPLCGSGVVFDRRPDGATLSFSNTSALHENDMVMVDRETGSYWWQVPGRSLGGPLAGEELVVLPSRMATWQAWRDEHPDTAVLARPGGRAYDRDPFEGYAERVDDGRTPFPVSAEALTDDRLTSGATVVVATVDGETRAWPVEPARTIDDRIGTTEVTVTVDGTGGTIVDSAGNTLAVRTSLWFAIVAAFPDVTVGR